MLVMQTETSALTFFGVARYPRSTMALARHHRSLGRTWASPADRGNLTNPLVLNGQQAQRRVAGETTAAEGLSLLAEWSGCLFADNASTGKDPLDIDCVTCPA
jgi:hypothetical protein